MARAYREVRKQKLVRNATIVCACLVVFIMLVERGMISKTDPPPAPSQSDGTQAIFKPVGIDNNIRPPGLDDDDSGVPPPRGSSESESESESSSDSEDDKTKYLAPPNSTNDNPPPPHTHHDSSADSPTTHLSDGPLSQSNSLSSGAQQNFPSSSSESDSSQHHYDSSKETPLSNQNQNQLQNQNPNLNQNQNQMNQNQNPNNLNSNDANLLQDHANINLNILNPNPPLDSTLNTDISNSSISSNSSSLVTNSTSPLNPFNTTYDDDFNDMLDENGTHHHDDDEDSGYPSDDIATDNDSTKITQINSDPKGEISTLTTGENSPPSPSPPTPVVDPVQVEKQKKKEKENAEKEMLERWVRQEYDDELAGLPSKIKTHNSTSLMLPRPLLFIHVPKTAGSTLGQIFKTNSPSKYYHFWSHPRLEDLHIVPDRQVVFGHFRYGLHYYLPNQTASYATMLREPVERVISYYHFHLQDTEDPAHKFAMEHTFEEWLEVSPAAQNEMTKCLSGIRSEFTPSDHSFLMAKHHLKSMGFVGLTERFDESIKMMQYYFGFKHISYSNTKVGVKKPQQIAPDVIEKIKERNRMDMELYEIAKEMFEVELKELSAQLLQQVMNN